MNVRQSTASPHRWRDLYHGVPHTIEPESRTGLDMFRATVARGGEAPLLHYFDRSFSADQVDAMSDALAVALQRRGVRAGDRVAMYLQNIPQVMLTVLAAWKCGATVVPCNPMLRERELVKIVGDAGCRVLICQDDLYSDVVRAALSTIGVRHTITTSALDYLEPGGAVPALLGASSRTRHAGVADLQELVVLHEGQCPLPAAVTATTWPSWSTRRAPRASPRRR